jgi:hypothetical protein
MSRWIDLTSCYMYVICNTVSVYSTETIIAYYNELGFLLYDNTCIEIIISKKYTDTLYDCVSTFLHINIT